jgi:phage terminase small subunit
MALNARQQRFVQEYLVSLNATQAANLAGYAHPQVQGPRLLFNVAIKEAVDRARGRIADKLEVTAERVIQEYARIAFANLSHAARWTRDAMEAVPSAELDANTAAAVKSVTIRRTVTQGRNGETEHTEQRIEMHDKKGALDSLARHLGLFKADQIDLTTLRAMAELGAAQSGVTADELLAEVAALVEEAERHQLIAAGDRQPT